MPHATVTSRLWTENELREVQKQPSLAYQGGKLLGENYKGLLLPEGGVIALATTQPKKIDDAKRIFEGRSAELSVLDPIEILHWFQSADEVSHSFVGNAYEKAEHILTRIYDTLGYEEVAARLRERGHDTSRVLFCVNDCGAYFTTDYSDEPEFERSRHEKSYGPWPGVEFGPVTDAQGGMVRFFADLKAMKERKEARGEVVDLSGRDHQVYLMFRLDPERSRVKIYSFEASVPIDFTTKPLPADNDVLTSFHFSKATDSSLPDYAQGLTRAQFGFPYMQYYSAESRALTELTRITQVPTRFKEAASFNLNMGTARNFYILSQHNVVQGGSTGTFSYLPENARVETRTYDTSQPGAYEQLKRNASAVVLGKHSPRITCNWESTFLDLFGMWSSLTVDKQVRVESFYQKPFVVLNRKNPFTFEGKQNGELDWDNPEVEKHFLDFLGSIDPKDDPWLQFILFTRYLHEKGFVKQEPRFLQTQFDPDDPSLEDYLTAEFRAQAGRTPYVPNYQAEKFGRDRTDMFEITFLGSASTRVASLTRDAYEMGYWSASQGWHVRTGGGRYGDMGHTAHGVFAFMKQNNDPKFSHFSAIQMPRTLQFEGVCLDPVVLKRETDDTGVTNKFLLVAPGFDQRMRSLFRSHANVAKAPGMGTYDEIVTFCRWKERGEPALQGKKLILLNQEQPGGNSQIRLMDAFLTICPARIQDQHFIVVNDRKAAQREVLKIHEDYLGTHQYGAFAP